jgi:hypothetical protein
MTLPGIRVQIYYQVKGELKTQIIVAELKILMMIYEMKIFS